VRLVAYPTTFGSVRASWANDPSDCRSETQSNHQAIVIMPSAVDLIQDERSLSDFIAAELATPCA